MQRSSLRPASVGPHVLRVYEHEFMNVEAYHFECRSCEYIVAYCILCIDDEVML